jgi:glycosyltransferase involved in cell wall biosynthesis
MKLLIISDAWYPQINGVVRTYEHLCAEMLERGHEVRVIGPDDFRFNMPMPGYSEIRLTLFPYKPLSQMIEEYAPDIIHLPTEGPLGRAGQRYCKRHNRPFTTAYHTHFPDYFAKRVARHIPFLYPYAHAIGKAYIRSFHSQSGGIMVATQSLENTLREWNFTAPMHHITRGVTMTQFYPGASTVLQDIQKPIALYVGRVAIEKNIEAFLDMPWHGSKVVVGDGPSRRDLESKYPDTVFAGIKTGHDLADYYRASDLFVFPSKTDTFGIVLIEALASGLPVAAYHVMGPQDIITQDILGALTDDDLAAAAHKALQTGNAQERAAFIKTYYTWRKAGEQFEAALTKTREAHQQ